MEDESKKSSPAIAIEENQGTPKDKKTKQLQKIVNKPVKKRDTEANEDSDKSESDATDNETAIINAVKEDEKTKSVRAKSKSQVNKYKTLKYEDHGGAEGFNIFAIESYIESNFSGLWFYVFMGVYMLFGFALILTPATVVLMLKEEGIPDLLTSISDQSSISLVQENFKVSFFLAAMFITYLFLREIFNQSVYIILLMYRMLNKAITKDTKVILFIVNDVRHLVTLFFFFIFAIVECNVLLEGYMLFQANTHGYQTIAAGSFCLAILLGMFIIEKFFLKITVAYFGNNVFSGRIGDVNLKTSIIRRILMYSEAYRIGSLRSIIEEIDTGIEITDSFLLQYDDFKIKSTQNCEEIVGTIYSRLNVSAITTSHIKSAFGSQWEDIWKFLLSGIEEKDEEITEISYEDLLKIAKSAYNEKLDLKRTLYDRDKLLNKLDTILGSTALIVTMTISTPVIGFDPLKYMAGMLPIIMSSGWLFSEIIKDVFNNFIFLLHEHPFDVGDKIMVKHEELTVLRIELMYSTFTSRGGTVCYIPNKELIKESIFNIRRSDIQTEIVTMTIQKVLTIEQVEEIKLKIQSILQSKELEAKKRIAIQDYEIQGNSTVLVLKIEYLCNFQDPEPKFTRRHKPMEIIQSAIKHCGHSYAEQKTTTSI